MQIRSLALTTALIALPALAHAESTTPSWSSSITPSAKYLFETDLESDVSLSVLRTGAIFKTGGPISEALFAGLTIDAEYANYDFSNLANSPSDLLFLEISPSASFYFNENFGIYGGVILTAGGEPDADVADMLSYGGFIGFNYQVAKGVWIGTGIGYSTQLEDDALIVPLVNVDWAFTDQLSLHLSGLGGTLDYKIDPQWTVFAEGRYEFRQYRLADDSIVPDGALTDTWVPLGVGVRYNPSDNITLSLSGGAVVWREVEFFDDDENKLSTDEADVTGYVALTAKFAW